MWLETKFLSDWTFISYIHLFICNQFPQIVSKFTKKTNTNSKCFVKSENLGVQKTMNYHSWFNFRTVYYSHFQLHTVCTMNQFKSIGAKIETLIRCTGFYCSTTDERKPLCNYCNNNLQLGMTQIITNCYECTELIKNMNHTTYDHYKHFFG